MGRTILTVTESSSGETRVETSSTLPPLGGAPALSLLASMAAEFSSGLSADALVVLRYEFLEDGDIPFRVAREVDMKFVRRLAHGTPITPLPGDPLQVAGPLAGWIICSDGWFMEPEELG